MNVTEPHIGVPLGMLLIMLANAIVIGGLIFL